MLAERDSYQHSLLRALRKSLIPATDVRVVMAQMRARYIPSQDSVTEQIAVSAINSSRGGNYPQPNGVHKEDEFPKGVLVHTVKRLEKAILALEKGNLRGQERCAKLEERNQSIADLLRLREQGEGNIAVIHFLDEKAPRIKNRSIVVIEVRCGSYPVWFEFPYRTFLRALNEQGLGSIERAVRKWDSEVVGLPEETSPRIPKCA